MKLLVSLLFIISFLVQAECQQTSDECAPVGEWEFSVALGIGTLTNPLNGGKNIPLILIPNVSFYGDKVFLDNNALGYTFYENNTLSFSAITQLNRENSFFQRWHPHNVFVNTFTTGAVSQSSDNIGPIPSEDINGGNNQENIDNSDPSLIEEENALDFEYGPPSGPNSAPDKEATNPPSYLPNTKSEVIEQISYTKEVSLNDIQKRKWALDAGAQLNWFISAQSQVKAQLLHNVNNVYRGYNAQIEYAHLFKVAAIDNTVFSLTTGLYWQSKKQVDYYYGIDQDDNVPKELFYQGAAAVNPYIKINSYYQINQDWIFRVSARREWLGNAVKDSPLVKDKTLDILFTGVEYAF